MEPNRPKGRDKNVTGQGKSVYRRGEGLGTGKVGSQKTEGAQGAGGTGPHKQQYSSGSNVTRAGLKISPVIIIIVLAILFGPKLLKGCGGAGQQLGSTGTEQTSSYSGGSSALGGLGSLITGGSGGGSSSGLGGLAGALLGSSSGSSSGSIASVPGSDIMSGLGGLLGSFSGNTGSVSTGWLKEDNTGVLDRSVASGSRSKRTEIIGGGRDTVTIMVYMCGTDLESKNGMATSDLNEMISATIGSNVNIIVYTGGCRQWKNSTISSTKNQVYKISSGNITCLESDAGSPSMTDPATLTSFIRYAASRYPANRVDLIFWDHGGGSLSGYGYDEKNSAAGSMSLNGINKALKDAGVKFDFIGFDACLMATVENALMLAPYADYLIASEETEPGVGWYYTNWLTKLSANTSMPTIEIGKNIADDFVDVCAQKCAGQKTTLSVVDLAELENTVPQELKDFAASATKLMSEKQYKTVSDARSSTREFATSSRIDQVDLIHFAYNMGTQEGEDLAKALLGAVKYNRTSSNMANSYGLSIYFPYKNGSKVSKAVSTYEAIGMDSEYARCIQQFASLELGGQSVSAGSASPASSLLGALGGSNGLGSLMGGADMTSLLSGILGGRSIDIDSAAEYYSENRFDPEQLVWTRGADGGYEMTMSPDQWSLVHDLELNVLIDDGEGYIDLGLDNVFDFTSAGALKGEYDGTWIAINDQPVAYYHTDTIVSGDSYTITGRVPVLLNGDRAELIIVFDSANPYGYIAGARSDYRDGETETIAKGMTEINVGDVIDFVADYYTYEGDYEDSYMIGEQLIVDGELTVSNVYLKEDDAVCATYLFTDIYCQTYWTPAIPTD